MTLILPFNTDSSSTATISISLPGRNIREVAKVCAALELIQAGCSMEITSLKLDDHLCTLSLAPLPLSFTPEFFGFVRDLVSIANKFNVNFRMPHTLRLANDEAQTFLILRAFATSKPLELTHFTATFTKCPENETSIPTLLVGEFAVRVEHQESTAKFLESSFSLGPTLVQIDRAEVLHSPATMKRFRQAKMGASVPITLRPLSPVRFDLVNRTALLENR